MARFALLLLAIPGFAQSPLGTITGTVTDPQSAGVGGAEVVVRNTSTNLTFRGATSGDGTYVIPSIPVGRYELTLAQTGFKSVRRSGLIVEVAQRLRVDVQLEIGQVTESVIVTAEVARVQTEDSSLGTVVEQKRIEELPLNGRHVFNLVKVVAGVTPRINTTDGFAEISNQGFSQIRINGGPAYGNQFFLDGVSNSAAVHNEISVVPMVDAVAEFRVETNALKAEFGQTSGGVVNAVTKSGGNEFHGSLYHFLRNDALDARNVFSTQPDRRTGRIKQVLRYNHFGGTVGGPVLIPKIYNGKNRTFFFAGYEQWKWRSTGSPRIGTVATDLQRAGNFSATRTPQGGLIPIYDPATTRRNPNGAGSIRDLFPNNIVPQNRMDPLSLKVLPFMPLPNATPTDTNTNTNNFVSLVGSLSDQGVTNTRIDHRFNDADSIFFRYSSTRNTRNDRGWGLGPADPSARNDQRDNHNAVLNHLKILSPSILNDFRFGATRQWLPFLHPSFDQNWPRQLGYPSIIPQDQFPPVQVAGLLNIGSAAFSGGLRAQQIIQIADSLTITRGNHNFKAGTDFRWWRLSFINRSQPSGSFNFNADLTNNPQSPAGTGFGMATFLLGEVSSGTLGVRPFFQFRANPFAVFLQDDWKITRRLTLNLGVRYDASFGGTELHNRASNFDPVAINPQTRLPGVLNYAGAGDYPRTIVDRDHNNIGPRFGFAWDPKGNGRMAIRGAYGLIYSMVESGNLNPDNANAFGYSVDTPFASAQPGIERAFRYSAGPASLVQPLGAAGGPSASRGLDVRAQTRGAQTPYIQQWNFAIQRAAGAGWVVSGVYAGSKGTKLFGANYNLNQLDPVHFAFGLRLQDLVDNPYFGQITAGPLSAARVQRQQILRPFPDYGSVSTWANNGLSTIYHSLQASLEKRFSGGVSALLSYTKSKLISESQAIGGGGDAAAGSGDYRIGRLNRRIDRAIDSDDVSQRMVASGLWELPFAKNSGRMTRGAFGGWQLNGIWTLQTGTPLVVRGTNNFTGIGYPNVTGNPTLPRGERTPARWFNTQAFANPPDFTIGNAPRTLPSTRGPGLNDLSFSLFKTFSLKERFRLETRWELFNALNTVNYNLPNTGFQPSRPLPGQVETNLNVNFGRILSALEPRRMQFGLRLAF
ncbi:MAG: TonB-dependent receptor [Acidobacteria bacterium]|nr:TonB-dependent receptor [Acidobacteriota bacterium]